MPHLRGRRGRRGAGARTRRLLLTYLPVNVTLSSSASAHPATQHAPGARYRGTAAALQLPYPWPCPTQRTDRGHVVTVLHAIHATHPAPTMAPYRAAPRHCSAAAPASRSLHTPRPSMTRLIRLGCGSVAGAQSTLPGWRPVAWPRASAAPADHPRAYRPG